ncbi:MAG: CDP-glycerol glycerophosphotransferase, partial [Thermoleophilaceae bacterium]|nr:CDP-glycerol glycerophosphotransferase [Thermoleophilaceae bacterium]
MPRISVVVPVYNVEPYLATCLDSLAQQTFSDLEVVMVDDGSTDKSAAIAQEFVDRDGRFRLLTQPNGVLSKARNTGTAAATGEFLAFVDSDDYLPPNAYEMLMGALEETGSDFATGNVQRVTKTGTRQVFFLAEAFSRTRLATHISRDRPLVADRTAWNKLFRRSFWDAQGFEFPVGVLNEDIPITLPAHFAAKSVDVISEPVYFWRIRGGEELSITQRRLEPRALLDRMRAVETVTNYLAEHGKREWKEWYEAGVVADDLRLYLNLLGSADDDYRELFLDRVNAYLDRAGKHVFDDLEAIDRLKWHLVRRRLMPELVEVLRFQREDLKDTPPVCFGGKWYGNYPFLDDERLKIPRSVYLLGGELRLQVGIDALDWDEDKLRVTGSAYITGIGAPEEDTQRISVSMLRGGRLKRVRLMLAAIKLDTSVRRRPDVTASERQQLVDLTWSGFEATLDPRKLGRGGRLKPGTWELYVTVRTGKIKRRRARFELGRVRPLRAIELPSAGDVSAKVVPTAHGGVAVDARDEWAAVRGHSLVKDDVLELSGEIKGAADAKLKLEVTRRSDQATFRYPLKVEGDAFSTRVKLPDLLGVAAESDGDEEGEVEERNVWDLHTVAGGLRRSVSLPEGASGTAWQRNGRAFVLARTKKADAALVEHSPRPVIDRAQWSGEGVLEVEGELPEGYDPDELVLAARQYAEEHPFPMEVSEGRFKATLRPAGIESLAGVLPLKYGTWDLVARPFGGPAVPIDLAAAMYADLPLATVVERKPFTLTMERDDRATINVDRDLDEDERGPYNQRRLRRTAYIPGRGEPVREAVVYSSFHGRQFSDSPRAIHEELVRRGADVEHLWVVRDRMCAVPDTAKALRDGSREFHEALATSRYLVFNDHFPDYFARRPDQVCLQTWHGVPLKRLGFDVLDRRQVTGRFTRWDQQVVNWQYVVSPNRFSTPILQKAYAIEGEMIETGYPRDDVLAGADLEARTRAVRQKLGLPENARVVLYAPTYRDHVVDKRGRYRLDLHLDLDSLRGALGPDTVILFRKHHYVADAVPTSPDGFVRDVSTYPDATEL